MSSHAVLTGEVAHPGRVLSINVGSPTKVNFGNKSVVTSIFKSPIQGKVAARGYNIGTDRQSDRSVHGGPYKAVYGYPSEHYAYWRQELPLMDLPFGMFGENLTTEGLDEENVCIGDRYQVGSAVLQVTQPRMPCFKLGIRFNRNDIVKRFWLSGLSGIYFSIVSEGELEAGDSIERIERPSRPISVAEVVRLYRGDEQSPELYARALQAPLFGSWKEGLRERRNTLWNSGAESEG